MTLEEIKQTTSMKEVLQQYGIQVNRRGFAHCPFHAGDREPSLKVYTDNFYCYGCNEAGDIFSFVQKMESCSFSEAFKILGGSFEKPTAHTMFSAYHRKNDAIRKQKRKERIQAEWLEDVERLKKENSELLTRIRNLVPLSDEWCEAKNREITVSGQLDQLCGVDGKAWQEWVMGGELDG